MGPIDWGALDSAVGGRFNSTSTLGSIINLAVPAVFIFGGFALLIYLIYGGFMYMTSGGNPKQTEQAKSILATALTGFIIIFFAYWITRAIGVILYIPAIQNIFGGV